MTGSKLLSLDHGEAVVVFGFGMLDTSQNPKSPIRYPRITLSKTFTADGKKQLVRRSFSLSGDFRNSLKDYLRLAFEQNKDEYGLTRTDLELAIETLGGDDFAGYLINTLKRFAIKRGFDFKHLKMTDPMLPVSGVKYLKLRRTAAGNFSLYYYLTKTNTGELVRDQVTVSSYRALFYNAASFTANVLVHSVALFEKEREYAASVYFALKSQWYDQMSALGFDDCDISDEEYSERSFYERINFEFSVLYGDYLWADIGFRDNAMIRHIPKRVGVEHSNKAVFLKAAQTFPSGFTYKELSEKIGVPQEPRERSRLRSNMHTYIRSMCLYLEPVEGCNRYRLRAEHLPA